MGFTQGAADQLEEITLLVMREKGIPMFRCDFQASKFQNLKYLQLSHNKLENLDYVDQLESLEELNVNFNNLRVLNNLERLRNLVSLSASNNQLEDVSGISGCTELRVLHLYKNRLARLEDLQKCFLNLHCLEELDVGQNPITKVYNLKLDLILCLDNLVKFNDEILSKKDRDQASSFQRQGADYRPSTAKSVKQSQQLMSQSFYQFSNFSTTQ